MSCESVIKAFVRTIDKIDEEGSVHYYALKEYNAGIFMMIFVLFEERHLTKSFCSEVLELKATGLLLGS